MSQKRKQQRAKHEEAEKKKAERVIYWIFAALIVLAVCFYIYASGLMNS